MKQDRQRQGNPEDFIARSPLYRECLAEKDELDRYRWIESEKKGADIGFERALLEWILNHREAWRASWRKPRS